MESKKTRPREDTNYETCRDDRSGSSADAALSFPPDIAAILDEADRTIQSMAGASHHRLYQLLCHTATRIAPVDAFYVGFYCEGRRVSFPYSFDGREYDDPAAIPYGDQGLSAWMLRNRRPYWFGEDGGQLLRRGRTFGDTERLSEDAVVVPIFDDASMGQSPTESTTGVQFKTSIQGLMSMQTYTPCAYDMATVRAFAFLAGSLSTVLAREREDERRRSALGARPVPQSSEVSDEVGAHLGKLRRGIDAAIRLVPPEAVGLAETLGMLRAECEHSQTEVAELLAGAALRQRGDPLAGLTERQREVALLAAQSLGVKQIAASLFISEHTAKDHMAAIRSRLGISGRSGVAAHLRRVLSSSS